MLSMHLVAPSRPPALGALETAVWRRGETSRVFRHGVAAVASTLVAFSIWLLSDARG